MLQSSKFYLGLCVTSFVSAVSALYSAQLVDVERYNLLTYLTVITFAIISWLVYFLSERAASLKDKTLFVQIVMINTMMKMFASVLLVIGFYYVQKPDTTKFIIPFIVVYLIFTIFEVGFMMRQSDNAKL